MGPQATSFGGCFVVAVLRSCHCWHDHFCQQAMDKCKWQLLLDARTAFSLWLHTMRCALGRQHAIVAGRIDSQVHKGCRVQEWGVGQRQESCSSQSQVQSIVYVIFSWKPGMQQTFRLDPDQISAHTCCTLAHQMHGPSQSAPQHAGLLSML